MWTYWRLSPMPAGQLTVSPAVPHLPYATFTEVIWGEQRVQEIWKRYRGCPPPRPRFLWVGFSCRFIAVIICAHASFLMRLYAQLQNERTFWLKGEEILKEDKKSKEHRGGQTLVEVVVCAVGWVVILPLVEMTAQSTALLALANYDEGVKQDQLFVNRINWMGRNVHS